MSLSAVTLAVIRCLPCSADINRFFPDGFYYCKKTKTKQVQLKLTFFMVAINTRPGGGKEEGGCTSYAGYSFQATISWRCELNSTPSRLIYRTPLAARPSKNILPRDLIIIYTPGGATGGRTRKGRAGNWKVKDNTG